MRNPFVTIAGAGPGSPDHLTQIVRDRLEHCDVVLYDSLLDPTVLAYCRPTCEMVYVGKRAGQHARNQEEINELLVGKAREGKHVLRLKGGDPFVFGRGGEECLALQAAGIPFEVLPGVTSAFSVPLLSGIPVTHRGVSCGVTVLTGHMAEGTLAEQLDFPALVASNMTLVFLMGLHAASEIARNLLDAGMAPETPVSVLCNGSLPGEVTVRTDLSRLPETIQRDPRIQSPGILVIGETAALDFRSGFSGPLSSVQTTVVGTRHFCAKMAGLLREQGGTVTQLPLVGTEPLDRAPLQKSIEEIRSYSVLAFTGRTAMDLFFACWFETGRDLRELSSLKIAAMGPATAEHLHRYRLCADLIPETYTSDGLLEAILSETKPGDRILLPRAEAGNRVLIDGLTASGREGEEIPLYKTVFAPCGTMEPGSPDFLVFASAEGVRLYLEHGGTVPEGTTPVCIGPYTRAALQHAFSGTVLTAAESTADGLLNTILSEVSP
ncbi:MAG: uroporphyrinogen-III C-methyltransferase [Clostridia bacterium]|nr:uroporphyrinogen-III C-methyltransferase [Clostridia bacterium]